MSTTVLVALTGLATLGNLAANIAATDVHAVLSERGLRGDVLNNHDLAHVVRDAISEIMRLAAAGISDRKQREALEKIAVLDERLWAVAEAGIRQPETIEELYARAKL